MSDCWGASLAQLHIAEQRKNKKAIAYWKDDLEKKREQEMIIWIREKYPMMYDKAIELSNKRNIVRNLWFDPRYWNTSEIKEFFEDLQFVNQEVWELIHIKLTCNINNKKAEKRFKEWKSKQ
jgi:hypothetical protein